MTALEWFRARVGASDYEMASHADEERQIEKVTMADLETAILGGVLIEDYEDRKDIRGHAYLIAGHCVNGEPLHVVVARTVRERMRICTVYRPKEDRFKDGKSRTRRG